MSDCYERLPSHSIHQPGDHSSYLGVPAPAGISDCYESMSRTPIRDRLPRLISSPARNPEGVGRGWKKPTLHSIFNHLCGLPKATVNSDSGPVHGYGAGIQEGGSAELGGAAEEGSPVDRRTKPDTLACRWQPA